MVNEIVPSTPGFGVAGLVMCDTMRGACIKQACEKWVELKCGETMVGRCCYSWMPVLLTEIRVAIDKLKEMTDANYKVTN